MILHDRYKLIQEARLKLLDVRILFDQMELTPSEIMLLLSQEIANTADACIRYEREQNDPIPSPP